MQSDECLESVRELLTVLNKTKVHFSGLAETKEISKAERTALLRWIKKTDNFQLEVERWKKKLHNDADEIVQIFIDFSKRHQEEFVDFFNDYIKTYINRESKIYRNTEENVNQVLGNASHWEVLKLLADKVPYHPWEKWFTCACCLTSSNEVSSLIVEDEETFFRKLANKYLNHELPDNLQKQMENILNTYGKVTLK